MQVLNTNLLGALYCSQAVARSSMVPGCQGNIINISSVASFLSFPRRLPYSIAKSGINALTRVLAVEWAPYNIRVNGIAPGYISTQLVEDAARSGHIDLETIRSKTPASKLGEVAQVADLALFLASKHSQFITGQIIIIDGGYTLTR
jgi:NAD(P)-dependent dehydrogenase (short-subunit alcohol dehydrogenase family)